MHLYADDLAQTREHALNNLQHLSSACLDAGEHLSGMLVSAGRDAIRSGCQASQMLDRAFEIIATTHQAFIEKTGAQVQAFDKLAGVLLGSSEPDKLG